MSDRSWAGAYAPVGRLYFAYFRRLPDVGGLEYWADHLRSGLPLGDISALFASSTEFRETYDQLDNADFARLVYRNVLGRTPDQGGLAYWVGLMDGGYPRGAVMTGFSESSEYRSDMANEIDVVLLWRGLLGSVPNGATYVDAVARLDAAVPLTTLVDELLLDPAYAARITP
jgi:hypothetical protein